MNSWMQFVLALLVVYRVAFMLTREEGPFGVFTRLRDWAGAHDYDESGQPATSFGRLASCPLCMGVYVALLVTLLLIAWSTWLGNVVLIWLGLAGAQTVLHKVMER